MLNNLIQNALDSLVFVFALDGLTIKDSSKLNPYDLIMLFNLLSIIYETYNESN